MVARGRQARQVVMEKEGPLGTSAARADRLEIARQAAEQRYDELFQQAPLGIVVSTPEGAIVACNPGFARMLGFTSVDEAVGTSMQALYATPSDRERFVGELREKTRLESYRVRLRRRDGRPIETLTNVVGSYDATGTLVELRGYLIDVTARVEAESALLVREQLFRAVFFGASDAMMLLDDRRAIVDANPAASELFGKTLADLSGEVLDNLFIDEGGSLAASWREFIGLGEAKHEHYVKDPADGTAPDGRASPRLVECSYRARVHTGRHLCIARDITDRRMVEDRLAQAARIESVGRLAGGIAHDFNNLLTAILGYTELLLAHRRPDDPEREDLEEIHKAGQRASALTQQLLAFGRKQVLQPREVDLNLAIGGLKSMLRRVLREDITLVIEAARAPALVRIDPHQIEQAVLNLVLNSRDALPMGGVIRVDVAHVTLSPDEMPTERRNAAGPYVRLRVVDNGTGITPHVRAHLFEPFFTTKELGKGTGLGLASVYGIVHQSGGFIVVDSPASGGTIFTLCFPAIGADKPEPDQPTASGRETVLLVEDEDAVRVVIGALLRRHGYQVIEAATPQGALEIFPHHADAIDLLLTDIVMPDMNGPALAQRLVSAKPGLRILFISGYSDAAKSALSGTHISFLAKPFQASALTRTVRELLDRPAQTAPS
jgi:two-component system cell cycle sensor histidine kinase/response regulator CckA